MKHTHTQKIHISKRLLQVLDQLEAVTIFNKENGLNRGINDNDTSEIPAHGRKSGRNDKEFPRA